MKPFHDEDVQQMISQPSYDARGRMNSSTLDKQRPTKTLSGDLSSYRRKVTLKKFGSLAVKGNEHLSNTCAEIITILPSNKSKSEEKYGVNYHSSVTSEYESSTLPNSALFKSPEKASPACLEEDIAEVRKYESSVCNESEKQVNKNEDEKELNSSATIFQLIYKDSLLRSNLPSDIKDQNLLKLKDFRLLRGARHNKIEPKILTKEATPKAAENNSLRKSATLHKRMPASEISIQLKNQTMTPKMSSNLFNTQIILPEQKPARINLMQVRNIQLQHSYRKAQRRLIGSKIDLSPLRQSKSKEDSAMQAIPKFLKKRDESDSKMSNSIDTGVNMGKETLNYEAETKKILTRVQTLPQIQPLSNVHALSQVQTLPQVQISKVQTQTKSLLQEEDNEKVMVVVQDKAKQQTIGSNIKLLESEESQQSTGREILISYKKKAGSCYVNKNRLTAEFLDSLAACGLLRDNSDTSINHLNVLSSVSEYLATAESVNPLMQKFVDLSKFNVQLNSIFCSENVK